MRYSLTAVSASEPSFAQEGELFTADVVSRHTPMGRVLPRNDGNVLVAVATIERFDDSNRPIVSVEGLGLYQ